jgi:hypothetical protein
LASRATTSTWAGTCSSSGRTEPAPCRPREPPTRGGSLPRDWVFDHREQSAGGGANYLSRLVRYLAAEAGIRQFLDIGTGLPTSPNVHEVAQGIIPEARIVYVDNDRSSTASTSSTSASFPSSSGGRRREGRGCPRRDVGRRRPQAIAISHARGVEWQIAQDRIFSDNSQLCAACWPTCYLRSDSQR